VYEQQLLVMMVPSQIRDDVIDVLMTCDGISGFNMETIAGYSKEHSQYNLREQVEGFREFFEFEVMHTPEQAPALFASLQPVCEPASVRYWVVPVLSHGHL
jgi:hypothetical protein